MKKQISVIITDLDNTLYDWVNIWYQSFNSMLQWIVAESGIEQTILENEIRQIFQKYGTSEYAFLIEEIPSLRSLHPDENLVDKYAPAIEEYRKARRENLQLYPTVMKTLTNLKEIGCLIVAYTESREFYTLRRIQKLNLDGVIDYVYTSPDHDIPDGLVKEKIRKHSPQSYKLMKTVHRYTTEGELKPNPRILRDIIKDVKAPLEQIVYVGDSLMKDISMAQDAQVADVFAKYGVAQYQEAYELLRRVSHWSEADVERERTIYSRHTIHPNHTLENSFSELFDIFEFVPFRS